MFPSFCNGGGIGDGVQFTWAEWPVFLRPFQCVACRFVFQLWGIVFVVLFLFYASVYFVIRHGMSSWLPSAGIWRICEFFFFFTTLSIEGALACLWHLSSHVHRTPFICLYANYSCSSSLLPWLRVNEYFINFWSDLKIKVGNAVQNTDLFAKRWLDLGEV